MSNHFGGAVVVSLACTLCGYALADQKIETVVVTGKATGTLIDRKVYTVTTDMQSQFGTAADVLNNIPSVTVDADGNVSLRNDGNVTILIDGKPSTQFSGSTGGLSLEQLAASDIERIEVMTSPPSSLKASGSAGVINIITKKHRRAGLSGNLRGSIGAKGRFVTSADFAIHNGGWTTSLSIGLRQDVRDRLTKDSRVVIDPAMSKSTLSDEKIREIVRRLVPSVKASIEYAFGEGETLNATFSNRNLVGRRNFLQQDFSAPDQDLVDSISDRRSRGTEWDTYQDEGLSYDRLLGTDGTLSLSLTRSIKQEDERYSYENTFLLPIMSPTFDTLTLGLDFTEVDFSADYERKLGSLGKIKLGYDFDTNDNLFNNRGANIVDGVAVPNPAVTNAFRYRNRVHAAYLEFQDQFGDTAFDLGLRYEDNRARTLLITGNIPGTNNDSGLYPSLHVKHSLDDSWDLTASVSRRITRPNAEALNPFIDFQDIHNLRAGNASLLPQDTWLYEIGYEHSGVGLNFGSTAYYRLDRNSTTDVLSPLSADVVLIQKENLPKTHSLGLEFQIDGRFGKRLSYSLSGNAFYLQLDARRLGASGLASTAGVNFKAQGNYRITNDDTFQLTFSRTDTRLTPQGTLGAVNVLNVGFKHQIDLRTVLVATVSDLLNGQGLHRTVSSPLLQDNHLRLQYGQIFYLGVVYGFGGPLSKENEELNYDQ